MKYLYCLFLIIGLLLWVAAANADVYSWTDENGVKAYGNWPPDNATNVKLVFKEAPHDANADQQRTETENKDVTDLIRELDQEETQQKAQERNRAAEAAQNQQPTQQERVAAEKERLEAKIAELEEKPLSYFGSQKNKRVRIGYYRYRLETLMQNPDKYFNMPSHFEGNVKPTKQP